MSIFDFITKRFSTKQAPINYATTGMGGLLLGNTQQSSRQNLEQYLRAYGENPWLYASVSIISQAVAEVKWHLYKVKPDGSREELDDHPLIYLTEHPNPQMTGIDLWELHQKYLELTGKSYIIRDKDQGVDELWVVPSPWMKPLTDARGNITAYVYERNNFKQTFKPEVVIPFVNTDPLNPLDGVGPAQPIGIALDTYSFATQTNRNFFYYGADPGVIVTLDPNAQISQEEIDRKIEQWEARHRGYGRAHKMTIISGATKVDKAGQTYRDMEFTELLENNRKQTLASYGLPYTMLGGTDLVQRGNAEVAQYTFARWVMKPRLEFNKRKRNAFLVEEGLEWDYIDPTPEDRAENLNEAERGYKGGFITINEAREKIGLDPLDEGDTLFTPQPSPFETFPPIKSFKTKSLFVDDDAKEVYWKGYIKTPESHEPKFIESLKTMWEEQKVEALGNVKEGMNRNDKLIDLEKSRKRYSELMTPVLTIAMEDAVKNGIELIKPTTPHKQLSPLALEWLRTRITWAANEIGQGTADLLSQALTDGFNAGESIDQISARVNNVFLFNDEVRAQRIARTEIMMASNQGSIEGYKQSGVSEVEFWAARDERTCEICMGMHGDIERINEAPPVPASTHPNCRCLWLPIVR